MSGQGFRPVRDSGERIMVAIDGVEHELPAGMSVLAALLCADAVAEGRVTPPDWFCGIGQCQRCRVRINGREAAACQTPARPGDVIETRENWSG
ncbi:2Fe-2S iron-sulfur cluster-binding protein [Spiribacter insolitus]|uniref:2Fe-2S iron-sulfur cluster-binding protein n=1 Tax=Spiribacter insolitus TaxID=3122417 RepID=A0ABV3T7U9_9GAMM